MFAKIGRLRAAFFMPAAVAGLLALTACETPNLLPEKLAKVSGAACPAQFAEQVPAFFDLLDAAIDADGKAAAAAAWPAAELQKMRAAGADAKLLHDSIYYGQAVAAFLPFVIDYGKARGQVYGAGDVERVLWEVGERALADARAGAKFRSRVQSVPCP